LTDITSWWKFGRRHEIEAFPCRLPFGKSESTLRLKQPVVWHSSRKAHVTNQVFADCITSYLSPLIFKYCAENNMDSKCLLIFNNAPSHPIGDEDYGGNIQVVFYPQIPLPSFSQWSKASLLCLKLIVCD
jgi:hypothetical protein